MNTTTPSQPPATLYLRRDGSIMLCRANDVIELRLTARQLLQLGMDALSVAVALDPATLAEVAAALDATVIPPHLAEDARRAVAESDLVPEAACPRH
ncbi:MAG: hypothetical protein AMXMBFR78_18200 [Rubrivivax sp.]